MVAASMVVCKYGCKQVLLEVCCYDFTTSRKYHSRKCDVCITFQNVNNVTVTFDTNKRLSWPYDKNLKGKQKY